MSKFGNGGMRPKNARETYVEQLSYGRGLTPYMNKKRKPFTHLNSVDDIDLAYQSTPDYLRQMAQQSSPMPTELILARNIPRTKSASEMTPTNNLNRSNIGNPKYKAQEDYYDEIQSLKREMKTVKDENSNLRAKIRRLEEDNVRKRKEIDALYDPNKDGDLRRTLSGSSTDRNNNSSTANIVMNLKQRIFKLESQLKNKETTIDEMKSDPKWTKSAELEIQNRALFGELERQKVARLNYIQQNDFMASLDEETKNAVRKLNDEKEALRKENESLKKKLRELDKPERQEQLSARPSDRGNDRELQKKIDDLQRDCNNYEEEIAQMKDQFKQMRRERDQCRDKFDQANDDLEQIKRDRDEYRKKLDQASKDLQEMKREHENHPSRQPTGRFSPVPKPDEHRRDPVSSVTRLQGSQSSITKKPIPAPSSITHARRGSSSSDERSPTKSDIHGSSVNRDRPSSPNNSNESALKTVQASLRGHLTRTEVDRTPKYGSPATLAPSSMKKSRPIDSDDEDIVTVSSKHDSAAPSFERKRDSFSTQPKSSSRQSLLNDKTKSNNRDPDLSSRRTPSPPNETRRPSSPRTGGGAGSKQGSLNDRIKLGSSSRSPGNDRESTPKLNRSFSPPDDNQRPSSPRGGSGSRQDLPNDRNKLGSDARLPTKNRESLSKLDRSAPTPTNNHRPTSPIPSSGSRQTLTTDRIKLGSAGGGGSRIGRIDQDAPSKTSRPFSPPSDHRSSRPVTPENSPPPPPRKSPTSSSKQNIKDLSHDDDKDVEY